METLSSCRNVIKDTAGSVVLSVGDSVSLSPSNSEDHFI